MNSKLWLGMLLVVAGCSGGAAATTTSSLTTTTVPSTTTTTTTKPDLKGEAVTLGGKAVTTYFEALGKTDPRSMTMAAAGPALAYARYILAISRASKTALGSSAGRFADPIVAASPRPDGSFRLDGTFVNDQLTTPKETIHYGAFEVTKTLDGWRISSFEREGQPISKYITDGSSTPPVDVEGAVVQLGTVFRRSDNAIVTFTVKNTRAGTVSVLSNELYLVTTADGRQYQADQAGTVQVQPGATADVVGGFPNVDDTTHGARLVLTIRDESFAASKGEVAVPPTE